MFAPGVVVMPEQEYIVSGIRQAGPDYLSLVGAKVKAGNYLSGSIDARAQVEILVEVGVAEQLFTSSEAALGQELTIRRLHHNVRDPTSQQTFTIVKAGFVLGVFAGSCFTRSVRRSALQRSPTRLEKVASICSQPRHRATLTKRKLNLCRPQELCLETPSPSRYSGLKISISSATTCTTKRKYETRSTKQSSSLRSWP